MKNSIKVFISVCIIVLFSACSFKQNSLEINQYAIDFKLDKNISKSISKSIYIDEVNVNKSFDNHSIFYTTKAFYLKSML